jgi:hypothetical protein
MTIVHPPLFSGEPTAYRTLLLTDDGRILRSVPLAARDDDEALSLVAAMVRDAGIELWDGLRFMAHFGPNPMAEAAT